MEMMKKAVAAVRIQRSGYTYTGLNVQLLFSHCMHTIRRV